LTAFHSAKQEKTQMLQLDFSKSQDGLIPAIAQDWQTGEVLMLAYINQEAWQKTLDTGIATYWTRSRKKLWVKGESSGNIQRVKEILVDCDLDTVIFKIEQVGEAACHEGYRSCFFRRLESDGTLSVQGERIFDPKDVYQK
jgi:phosphoribosyl-AMP cyclohydrolase